LPDLLNMIILTTAFSSRLTLHASRFTPPASN
jgi:hypothetical protein